MHEYIAFFVTICERWLGVALVHRHCAIHCAGLPAVLFVADGTWLHTTAYATRYLHPAPLAAMLCVVSDSPLSNACVLGGSLMTYSARLVVIFPTTARRPCHDTCVSHLSPALVGCAHDWCHIALHACAGKTGRLCLCVSMWLARTSPGVQPPCRLAPTVSRRRCREAWRATTSRSLLASVPSFVSCLPCRTSSSPSTRRSTAGSRCGRWPVCWRRDFVSQSPSSRAEARSVVQATRRCGVWPDVLTQDRRCVHAVSLHSTPFSSRCYTSRRCFAMSVRPVVVRGCAFCMCRCGLTT